MSETAAPQESRRIARRAGWFVIGLGIADLAYGLVFAPPPVTKCAFRAAAP